MKNYQFCTLMAVIAGVRLMPDWANTAIFFIMQVMALYYMRKGE